MEGDNNQDVNVVETQTEESSASENSNQEVNNGTTSTVDDKQTGKEAAPVASKTYSSEQVSEIVQRRVNEINQKNKETFENIAQMRSFLQQYYDKYGDISQQNKTPEESPKYTKQELEILEKARKELFPKEELEKRLTPMQEQINAFTKAQQELEGVYLNKANAELVEYGKKHNITSEEDLTALGNIVASLVKSDKKLGALYNSGRYTLDTTWLTKALSSIENKFGNREDASKKNKAALELEERQKKLPNGLPPGGKNVPARKEVKLTEEERQELAFRKFIEGAAGE